MRHVAKDVYIRRLLRSRDFLAISETHGLEGEAAAWRGPQDCVGFYSAGTARRAGVGLLVKRSFMQHFDAAATQWLELLPGRAAVLRLRGPQGSLDLYSLYFPTGTDELVLPRGAALPPDLQQAVRQ